MSTTLVDPDKFKLTCLIPKDLMKEIKQNALDYDTNITTIVIEQLRARLKTHPNKK